MVGHFYDREIVNFPIRKTNRDGSSRDIFLFAAGILLVSLIVIGYIYIPNQIRQVDYSIELAKKTLRQLEQERAFLQTREAELTSLARLEQEAERMGLLQVEMEKIRFLHSATRTTRMVAVKKDPAPPNGG
ncbi:MAG: hypothetical protein JXQ27_05720 [Acidobacteria bacterium]|nr:hypothetical protein [Acidobacteriota bacterium]